MAPWNPFTRKEPPLSLTPEQKGVGIYNTSGGVWVPMGSQDGWSERRYEKLSTESYMKNSIGFRCMKPIDICRAPAY